MARQIRAFGSVHNTSGAMQQDHSRGSAAGRQFADTGEFMTDGGNSAGKAMSGVQTNIVPDFLGRSGQPDNQSTNRPKGST